MKNILTDFFQALATAFKRLLVDYSLRSFTRCDRLLAKVISSLSSLTEAAEDMSDDAIRERETQQTNLASK